MIEPDTDKLKGAQKRVLVCGGREYSDRPRLFEVLHIVHRKFGISCIIQGGARGADRLAKVWADINHIEQIEFPADWKKHGRAAGPLRNGKMLETGKPDVVIAFPGGRGTQDMLMQSRKYQLTHPHLEVLEIK